VASPPAGRRRRTFDCRRRTVASGGESRLQVKSAAKQSQ
jgi:hypothetical protein